LKEVLSAFVPLICLLCAIISLVTIQATHQLLIRRGRKYGRLIFAGKLIAIGEQLPLAFVFVALNVGGVTGVYLIVATVLCEFGAIWLTFHFAKKHPAWAKRTSDALDRFVQARTK
jgi:hypothetical protein